MSMDAWEMYRKVNEWAWIVASVEVNNHKPFEPFRAGELTAEQMRGLCRAGVLYRYCQCPPHVVHTIGCWSVA